MKKSIAIAMLGPTTDEAGRRIGCSGAAVRKWPDELPPRLVDRVIAASVRAQFDRGPISGITGRVTLHPDLFAYLWHEALMLRAEKARKFDADALARKIAEHREAKAAKQRPVQDRQTSTAG